MFEVVRTIHWQFFLHNLDKTSPSWERFSQYSERSPFQRCGESPGSSRGPASSHPWNLAKGPWEELCESTLHDSRKCLVIEAPGFAQCAACTTVHGGPSGSTAALSSLFLEILQGAVIKLLFLPNPSGIGFVPLKPNEIEMIIIVYNHKGKNRCNLPCPTQLILDSRREVPLFLSCELSICWAFRESEKEKKRIEAKQHPYPRSSPGVPGLASCQAYRRRLNANNFRKVFGLAAGQQLHSSLMGVSVNADSFSRGNGAETMLCSGQTELRRGGGMRREKEGCQAE